jgi:hypothetical protein
MLNNNGRNYKRYNNDFSSDCWIVIINNKETKK